MQLRSSFEVPSPPEDAWALLMDVPRVVPCMPGAELTETVDDSHWKAKLSVKLGPISLAFATDVEREEVDESARRVKLGARARETRGRGAARATIESTLAAANGGTRIDIVTDLSLSGAVAQYGRGMVEDVSSQLVGRFADCLKEQLAGAPAQPEPAAAGRPAAGEPGAAEPGTGQGAPPPAPPTRPAPAPAPAPVKPVGGLSLMLRALGRAIVRFVRGLAGRAR